MSYLFKEKVKNIVDAYLLTAEKACKKVHPVRQKQLREIIDWTLLCDEEILVSRLEHALENWPCPHRFFSTVTKEQSALWRDLKSCVSHYYKTLEEQHYRSGQDRYERYEEKMCGLMRFLQYVHHQEVTQMNQEHARVCKQLRDVQRQLVEELDVIKSEDRLEQCISWG